MKERLVQLGNLRCVSGYISIIQYQNICSLVCKIRVYELSLSRCYITLRCPQQNHSNIFYFVKRQMMLTWGQNSIKVPFRFRKLYLEKNILLLSSFSLSVLYICFCALSYSSSRSNFAFELVILGVVCVQGMKKLPRSFL